MTTKREPPKHGRRATEDRTVRAWLFHELAKIRVRVIPPGDEEAPWVSQEAYAIGEMPVILAITDAVARPFKIDLTAMSEEELDCFAEIMHHAIEGARPVIQKLDKRAVEAFDGEYDDIPQRALRGRPAMFKRPVITDLEWGTKGVGLTPIEE